VIAVELFHMHDRRSHVELIRNDLLLSWWFSNNTNFGMHFFCSTDVLQNTLRIGKGDWKAKLIALQTS
jgi:hypothetical protein